MEVKMKLFTQEKDLILKITNLVLLIWLISAVTFFQVTLVDVVWPEKDLNYQECELLYCFPGEKLEDEDSCLERYEVEKNFQIQRRRERKKGLFLSIGNIVIVTVGLYLLNRSKK